MEENHTFDENEFVETLQAEMPNVEQEMVQTLDGVDNIEQAQQDPHPGVLLTRGLPRGGLCGDC